MKVWDIFRLVLSLTGLSLAIFNLRQIYKITKYEKARAKAFDESCKLMEACIRVSAKKYGNEDGAELDSYDLSDEEKLRYEKIVIEKDLNIELISLDYFNTWD
nr:MAG TPA: hypothetical protein [Caudoviricetes sp.]